MIQGGVQKTGDISIWNGKTDTDMRMPARTIIFSCLIPAVIAALGLSPNTSQSDRIPEGWKLDEIADGALFTWDPQPEIRNLVRDAKILVWKTRVDSRPLLLEQCIVWLRCGNPAKSGPWILAHVGRHPSDDPRWFQAAVSSHEAYWIRSFDHPPGNSEVEEFLSANQWWSDANWWYGESVGALTGPDGSRLLDADVCTNAWEEAIGSKPRMTFPAKMVAVGGIPKMLTPTGSIRLSRGSIVISIPQAYVSSEFDLQNRGDAITVAIGFPERSWDRTHLAHTKDTRYANFQCFVDSKLVPLIRIPEFFHPRELIPNVERCLLVATVSFAKNELHRMRVSYTASVGNDLRDGRFLGYTLATANSWLSGVGQLLVTVDVSGGGNKTIFAAYPSGYRQEGPKLVWDWGNTKIIVGRDLLIRWSAEK